MVRVCFRENGMGQGIRRTNIEWILIFIDYRQYILHFIYTKESKHLVPSVLPMQSYIGTP